MTGIRYITNLSVFLLILGHFITKQYHKQTSHTVHYYVCSLLFVDSIWCLIGSLSLSLVLRLLDTKRSFSAENDRQNLHCVIKCVYYFFDDKQKKYCILRFVLVYLRVVCCFSIPRFVQHLGKCCLVCL